MSPIFAFLLLKDEITDLKWSETTEYLAACSFNNLIDGMEFNKTTDYVTCPDGWIKVKFNSLDAN